ncbi:MAG: DNA alkylation repair protein [Oscillatoriales cyanobacterium C42_A2020_001]|nr:DNA alkylation repair protein [Leptolyngbyaceae cyanobacterium C42_A2020_001]
MKPEALVEWVTKEFERRRNPEKAIAMAAYMQNRFPFWGIQAPEQGQIAKHIFPHLKPFVDQAWLEQAALLLYEQDQREYHYFAVNLLSKFGKQLTIAAMPTVEQLVVTHSWWDTVDAIASRIVGDLVLRFPELAATMDTYSTYDNLWLRRVAILHQLNYKQETDVERLFRYCATNAESKEFFIRKAIGWALREYAKTDSEAVIEFVRDNRDRLSNLSKREALKRTSVDWREI